MVEGRKAMMALMMKDADEKRLLMDVEDRLSYKAICLIALLASFGFGKVKIISGLRSIAEQEKLYGIGRTKEELRKAGINPELAHPEKKKVTWTIPRNSKHVQGKAIDISFDAYTNCDWVIVGKCADIVGLEWGGNWRAKDYGHFELYD